MTVIRDAQRSDTAAIIALIREMAAIDGETSPLSEPFLAQYLGSPNSHILVAEDGGQVVALLSYSIRPDLYHAGDCCLVEILYVQPEQRCQGIGGMLLDTLIDRSKQAGCKEIAVGVVPDNVRAARFYQQHGICEQALLLEMHL